MLGAPGRPAVAGVTLAILGARLGGLARSLARRPQGESGGRRLHARNRRLGSRCGFPVAFSNGLSVAFFQRIVTCQWLCPKDCLCSGGIAMELSKGYSGACSNGSSLLWLLVCSILPWTTTCVGTAKLSDPSSHRANQSGVGKHVGVRVVFRGSLDAHIVSGGCRCALVGVPWRGSVSARLAWGDIVSFNMLSGHKVLKMLSILRQQGTPMRAHLQLPDCRSISSWACRGAPGPGQRPFGRRPSPWDAC